MNIIVGTAGHIDHGKTSLVKALTGVDTDRLPEEKLRGITIDLGFAELVLNDLHIGFVDVPGHERFVKNMLAGVGGIDMIMLVVAADEGVMPQTREHFEICRLLGIKHGVIALTKADKVEPELLEIAKLDVEELVKSTFLESSEIVAVSSVSGEGLEHLKMFLEETAKKIPERKTEKIAVLPIDRVFTKHGFGAVVTGTLNSGEIKIGDTLELLPQKQPVRVRGLQTYEKSVENVTAGQRTAVNIAGIDHKNISRGNLLSERGYLEPTQIIDVQIELMQSGASSLKSRQRVRVHLGTVEVLGRVQVLNDAGEILRGDSGFAQLRLESEIVGTLGDRIILRQYSPQHTIAGAVVLDVFPQKHRKKQLREVGTFLENMSAAIDEKASARQLALIIEKGGTFGVAQEDLHAITGWKSSFIRLELDKLAATNNVVICDNFSVSIDSFNQLKQLILHTVEEHHKSEPFSRGLLLETLRERIYVPDDVFRSAQESLIETGKIGRENDVIFSNGFRHEPEEHEKAALEHFRMLFYEAGLAPPALDEVLKKVSEIEKMEVKELRKLFQTLLDSGELIKISQQFFASSVAVEELKSKLKLHALQDNESKFITVAEFKDIAGVSRKFAIPLLEYFDNNKITRRAGDKRLIL
ncbi:MAG: selenocysteine-specific translation elongation factor [Pyrinomonadaceae bacterium]